jgi:hypothetical protein
MNSSSMIMESIYEETNNLDNSEKNYKYPKVPL